MLYSIKQTPFWVWSMNFQNGENCLVQFPINEPRVFSDEDIIPSIVYTKNGYLYIVNEGDNTLNYDPLPYYTIKDDNFGCGWFIVHEDYVEKMI